jgi:hypothetical protein
MKRRGNGLIPRYNIPLVYRNEQNVEDSDNPFDNDSTNKIYTFKKVIAEMCTIQEARQKDLLLLPDGVSAEKVKRILTNTYIPSIPEGSNRLPAAFYIPDAYFTLDEDYPAEIGGWYNVVTARPRLNGVINHYDCLVVRIIPEQDQYPPVVTFDDTVKIRSDFFNTNLWRAIWLT